LLANLQISGGAKKLLQIGLDNDIKDAAKCDSTNIVPEIKFNEIDYSILGEPTALDYL
jgi:phosphosulfolactate phosphohydrolase-like enzyme